MNPLNPLWTVNDIIGIYCDAVVNDADGYLLFGSFWGRDTAIQELVARLSLPQHDNGLPYLRFEDATIRQTRIGNPDRLSKMTGRLAPTNVLGDLVQLWLYDQRIQTPDYVNQQAFLLRDAPDGAACSESLNEEIWQLFKAVCPLPVLESWQEPLLAFLHQEHWISYLNGFRVQAIALQLPATDLETALTQMIRQGILTLD